MAFDMRVIGFRHDPRAGAGDADAYTRYPTSTPCCRLAPLTYMRMPAPLAEPAADRNEKIASLHPLDLIAPEPRHACCCAEFPGLGLLLTRNCEGALKVRLRFRRVLPGRNSRRRLALCACAT
jgi:hypothetical protein